MIWCHLQLSLLSVIYKCIKFSLKFTKPYDLKVRGPFTHTLPPPLSAHTKTQLTERRQTYLCCSFGREENVGYENSLGMDLENSFGRTSAWSLLLLG